MTDAIATLESLLASRYSCRAYKPDAVPREIIDRILGAAQRTASWCNSQPWQVTITSGEATKKFRDVLYPVAAAGTANSGDFPFPREYRGVYLDRRRESKERRAHGWRRHAFAGRCRAFGIARSKLRHAASASPLEPSRD